MKYSICLLILILTSGLSSAQSTLFSEQFNLADGTSQSLSLTASWSLDISETSLAKGSAFEVLGGVLVGKGLNGVAKWQSGQINISGNSGVFISMDISENGKLAATDYVACYYSVDGQTPVLFHKVSDDLAGGGPINVNAFGISGSQLEIIINMYNDDKRKEFQIDNITVGVVQPVYSKGDGNWTDLTKWSLTDKGAVCDCKPQPLVPAIITSGSTIDLSSDTEVLSLTVKSGGTARWTSSRTLTVKNGGSLRVEDGAKIDANGFSPTIVLEGTASVIVDDGLNGLMTDDIEILGDVSFSGSGKVEAQGRILINGSGITVTNSLESGIKAGTTLEISRKTTGNTLINNGVLEVDEIKLSNSKGFVLENHGTVTINGDIVNVDRENLIQNKENSVLNYGGIQPDADIVLDASEPNNTVNYFASVNGPVITPQSSYWHLHITGTGTKTAQDVLDINGMLSVSSEFDTGGKDINLRGDLVVPGLIINNGNTFTFDGNNQSIYPGPSTFSDVVFTGSGSKKLLSDFTVTGILTNTAMVDFATEGTSILLGGDFVNRGSINNKNEKFVFDGIADQRIFGSGSVMSNIELNKTQGKVIFESPVSLLNELIFQKPSELDVDGSGNDQVFTLVSNQVFESNIGPLPGGAIITGNLTAERYLPAYGRKRWRNVSTPVLNSTIQDLQNEILVSGNFTGSDNGRNGVPAGATGSLMYYDNTIGDASMTLDDRWVEYPNTTNTATVTTETEPGRGFILWIRETDDVSFDLRGNLVQGDVDFAPTGSNERWNLLGNPYPSAINWDASGWTKAGIQGNTIHIWDGLNYLSWNGTIGSLGSGIISKGQSFWVQGSRDNVTLTATESVKVSDKTSFLRQEGESYPHIEITAQTGEWKDITYIAVIEGANTGFDEHDAGKLKNSVFNLSTATADGVAVSINATDQLTCESEMKLHLRDAWVGSYTLSFANINSFYDFLTLKLQDRFTKDVYDLKDRQTITFEVTEDPESFGDDRFSLLFEGVDINSEIMLSGTQNCDSKEVELTIHGSQQGVYYEISIDGISYSHEAGTGGDLLLTIPTDYLANGINSISVLASTEACKSIEVSNSIEVEVLLPPSLHFDPDTGIAEAEATGQYQWFVNELPIEKATQQSLLIGNKTGAIHFTVSNDRCSFRSELLVITADDEIEKRGIEAYPNPFRDNLSINIDDYEDLDKIELIDARGSTVVTQKLEGQTNYINTGNLKPGVYVVKISGNGNSFVIKVIKN